MTQKEIINRCKSILEKTPINGYISDTEDFNFLIESFSLCPYYDMKSQGQKIIAIQKRSSGSYGTSCFWLIRKDKTSTDISYRKMFRNDPQTDDVLAALRTAIDPIISRFRENFIPFVYENRLIEKVEDVDVDHFDLKFRELASIWIESKGGISELIKKVNATEDGSSVTCFTEETLNTEFREFHNAHTHLRFLPREVNRKLH